MAFLERTPHRNGSHMLLLMQSELYSLVTFSCETNAIKFWKDTSSRHLQVRKTPVSVVPTLGQLTGETLFQAPWSVFSEPDRIQTESRAEVFINRVVRHDTSYPAKMAGCTEVLLSRFGTFLSLAFEFDTYFIYGGCILKTFDSV
jgi:hypothetical protein